MIIVRLKDLKARIGKSGNELFWIGLGLIIQLFAGVITVQILTNYLSTEEYGRFSLVNSIIQLVEVVIFSSLVQGAGRFAYYTKSVNFPFIIVSKLINKIFVGLAVIVVSTFIVLMAKSNELHFLLIPTVLLLILFDVKRDILLGVLHMKRERKTLTLFRSADKLGRMVIVLVLGFLCFASVANVLFGYVVITVILLILITRKGKLSLTELETISKISTKEENILKKKIFAFASPFAFLSILTWLLTWADRWVLSSQLTLDAVGIYSSNSQIGIIPFAMLSSVFLTFFGPILFKQAEGINSNVDYLGLRKKVRNTLALHFLLSALLLFVIYLTHTFFLKILLGENFISKGNLFMVLTGGWLLFQFAQVQATLSLYTAGHSKYVLYANIISGVFYLILVWILVEDFGSLGAAFAFAIANIIRIIAQYIISFKAWKDYLSQRRLLWN